jgi:hypothetical protein
MLGRKPRQVARLSSPSARLTRRVKPRSEISAPGLLTVLWITSSLPRSTSTSVTASLSDLREEIASRCAWLLLRASSISASSSSRADCDSTGPATSIASSKASVRMVRGGAVSIGARRLDNSARAEISRCTTRHWKTSSNRPTCSSEKSAAPLTKRSVTLRSASTRFATVPWASVSWSSSSRLSVGKAGLELMVSVLELSIAALSSPPVSSCAGQALVMRLRPCALDA